MTAIFTHRLACPNDIDNITQVMNAAIEHLQKGFLTPEQITASFETMGLDTTLIKDQTYFVILHGDDIVGCGGWSRRATLFGANHTTGRDDALLNPEIDAARIRAMYTHPQWNRQGIGRMIISLCEAAASQEGFTKFQLAATLAGQPLYHAAGYHAVENFIAETSQNIDVPLIKMAKTF